MTPSSREPGLRERIAEALVGRDLRKGWQESHEEYDARCRLVADVVLAVLREHLEATREARIAAFWENDNGAEDSTGFAASDALLLGDTNELDLDPIPRVPSVPYEDTTLDPPEA